MLMLPMTTYHHGDLREALLASAMKIIEKEGVAGLSVRAAARRAKVSHNAPYRHFPDRDSLLAGIATKGFTLLAEELKGGSGKAMGEAYVRFALRHPQLFRLMFGGLLPSGKYAELQQAGDAAYRALVDSFKPHSTEDQAQVVAAAAWSLVHGLANLLLDGHFLAARKMAGGDVAFVHRVQEAVRFVLPSQRSA
jgi:AcrR family transcriptional regulator